MAGLIAPPKGSKKGRKARKAKADAKADVNDTLIRSKVSSILTGMKDQAPGLRDEDGMPEPTRDISGVMFPKKRKR